MKTTILYLSSGYGRCVFGENNGPYPWKSIVMIQKIVGHPWYIRTKLISAECVCWYIYLNFNPIQIQRHIEFGISRNGFEELVLFIYLQVSIPAAYGVPRDRARVPHSLILAHDFPPHFGFHFYLIFLKSEIQIDGRPFCTSYFCLTVNVYSNYWLCFNKVFSVVANISFVPVLWLSNYTWKVLITIGKINFLWPVLHMIKMNFVTIHQSFLCIHSYIRLVYLRSVLESIFYVIMLDIQRYLN